MLSKNVVQEILLPAMQAQKKRKKNWAGKQNLESKKCVRIPGDGSQIIQTDTKNKK